MKTKETLLDGNYEIDAWLNEEKLGKALELIFPNETFIHDKIVPDSGIRKRPDFRCERLKLIVEFDGSQHYTDVKWCYDDKEKDATYTHMGYKIVRIPYFVQLSSKVIEHLFGVKMEWHQVFPYGFIVDKNEVLPSDFCSLGYEHFLHDLKVFDYIKADILASLKWKLAKYQGDWNRILPLYVDTQLQQKIELL